MIVAVGDFNMGAMENKGLNIFNAKYVLARPETATDDDYEDIEGVIAHEYFHNWTGNRVTCRDWFQLTLKEGLTVFRDQQFTADMTSRAVEAHRATSRTCATPQFAEDAGPMAHPIRPESYIEMNNFYTATVYEKGAEVVRMMHTLLGAEGFRRGMDLYFERHDGQAVTCDDFRAGDGRRERRADLAQFERWYAQAGTPRRRGATARYDAAAQHLHAGAAQRVARPRRRRPPSSRCTCRSRSGCSGPTAATCRCALAGEAAARGDDARAGAAPSASSASASTASPSRRCRRCCAASRRR